MKTESEIRAALAQCEQAQKDHELWVEDLFEPKSGVGKVCPQCPLSPGTCFPPECSIYGGLNWILEM